MLRVLLNLFDGLTLRYLGRRIALTLVALGVLLFGLCFLLAAVYQAIAGALGTLDASLIFAALFIIAALGLFGAAAWQWRRRPRPLLARARYGVAEELLILVQTLIRKDPTKAVIAALILGAITEHLQKRSSEPRE